jgi:hypothetical protein
MTPEPANPAATQHATPAPTQPEQVLAWLATQTTPDHGESAPPMPADLLSDIQRTFGLAPETPPAASERTSLWQRAVKLCSARSTLGWGSALAAACVVALLVWQHGSQSDSSRSSDVDAVRGGQPVATLPDISWHWIGLENFPVEKAKLQKEDLTEEVSNSSIVVTLDAASDPLQVKVTTTKKGIPQPDLSLSLPKQSLPTMRPAIWVEALQQLQNKLQSSPP